MNFSTIHLVTLCIRLTSRKKAKLLNLLQHCLYVFAQQVWFQNRRAKFRRQERMATAKLDSEPRRINIASSISKKNS